MSKEYKSRMRAFAESILKENCCGHCPAPLVSPVDVMRVLQTKLGQGVAVSVNLINTFQTGDYYQVHANVEPKEMPESIEVGGYTLNQIDVGNGEHYFTFKVAKNKE